jgi:hypothetical protein
MTARLALALVALCLTNSATLTFSREAAMAEEKNEGSAPDVVRDSTIWRQLRRGLEENFPDEPRIVTHDEGAFWRFVVTAARRSGPAGGEVTLRKDTLVVTKVLFYQ